MINYSVSVRLFVSVRVKVMVVNVVFRGGDGAVGVHEGRVSVADGLGGGLIRHDAAVRTVVVAQGRPILHLRGQHVYVLGTAVGVGTDEHDIPGLQIVYVGDPFKAHLSAPIHQIGYHASLHQGLIRIACPVQDPVYETVTAGAERAMVDTGIGAGIAVLELFFLGVFGDVLGFTEEIALEQGVGRIYDLALLVANTRANGVRFRTTYRRTPRLHQKSQSVLVQQKIRPREPFL